ncbi:DUF4209 domain-containing protein [Micrococcus luteus]|uniref:DUF4209 domain-containing protein n=1 Tax=Micrococcus luteus TaxID=1270 RepID=UPI003F6DC941
MTLPAVRHDLTSLPARDRGQQDDSHNDWTYETGSAHEDIFGAGIVMEMKAMLIVQGGLNLRNDIAHGLLDDNSAWSYSALYMWWFCLRLVTWPVIEMISRARTQSAESG